MPEKTERLNPEKPLRKSFLDRYRPTTTTKNITDIDLSPFIAKGINTLLLDAEGTFVPYKGQNVPEDIKTYIAKQRLAGIDNIAIVTNSRPIDEESRIRLNGWTSQIGADAIFSPRNWYEHKPAPNMLLEAVTHFNIKPEQALVIGDKLTADIKAANAAGIDSIWIEKPLGDKDMLLDKVIRRRAEKGLRWLQTKDPEKSDPKPIPGKTKFDEFMANHGRTIADTATWVRLASGPAIAGLILTDHPRASQISHAILVGGTDFIDGKAARRSKDGETKTGGKIDQRVDKITSAIIEGALVAKRRIHPIHPIARIGRDLVITSLRKKYDAQGIDTKASWIGKIAFASQFLADNYAMSNHSRRHPKINNVVQWLATGIKVGSIPVYINIWEKKKEEKKISDKVKTEIPAKLN